jgi:hypothetical protein
VLDWQENETGVRLPFRKGICNRDSTKGHYDEEHQHQETNIPTNRTIAPTSPRHFSNYLMSKCAMGAQGLTELISEWRQSVGDYN